MEKLIRVIFKMVYLAIKSAEKIPLTGPFLSKAILWTSEFKLFKWLALKYKND